MSPNLLAFFASLCFGVVVFPWQSTVRTLGPAGVFLFAGGLYVLTGAVFYIRGGGFDSPLTIAGAATALVMGCIYVAAIVSAGYAFGSPKADVSVLAAITAAYPLYTAVIMFARGQRYSPLEIAFFLMAVIGVVGLGLFSGGSR